MPTPRKKKRAAGRPDQLHVLVVDDEQIAANALATFLSGHGFRVTTASDGSAGLAAFDRDRPDAVITDLRMPGVDGIELIRSLRGRGAGIPVVAVTGCILSPSDRRELMELGADAVIQKPPEPEVILRYLRRTAAGRCRPPF